MAEKYLTLNPAAAIDEAVEALDVDKVLIVTDTNVEKIVIPELSRSNVVAHSPRVAINPGEEGKNLESVCRIWDKLEETGATRRSLIINIGGGVVTDLGGFAASAFKRGIRTVNYPTTLLGAVDAATGGKTGINFRGLKNEIGAFHQPSRVIVSARPFASLPGNELLSGYAEMVKTAMISDRNFYSSLLEVEEILGDELKLGEAVAKCVEIKEEIVAQDPTEQGLRKVLNFGHTAGHAFESMAIEKRNSITHGKAVAHGILVALILSNIKLGLDSLEIAIYSPFLKNYYGTSLMNCKDTEEVLSKMKSDKKNRSHGQPSFTLLSEIGNPVIDCHPTEKEIKEALEIYRDITG